MQRLTQRTIPVAENGRMNLPANMRRALGLKGAGHVIVSLVDDEIHITTADAAIRKARELAAPYKPLGEQASDALIAERRAETLREDAQAGNHG